MAQMRVRRGGEKGRSTQDAKSSSLKVLAERVGGVLGIRVSVEVNPRCAQDLRIGFVTLSPIVSKTQTPASEAEKLNGFLGARALPM